MRTRPVVVHAPLPAAGRAGMLREIMAVHLATGTEDWRASRARRRLGVLPRADGRDLVALPRLPAHPVVERTALVGRLRRARASVVVVTAPTGYGKSTVVAQWARSDRRPFAWIPVREADDDPATLLEAIAAELHGLPRNAGGAVLVLEDAQALRSRASIDVVGDVAATLRGRSAIVLVSRGEPPGMGRLRTRGAVLELGPADLAMSDGEAAELLQAAAGDLAPGELAGLVRRAEGWPVALRLAAVARSGRLRGDDRRVVDYVRVEVLAGLDAGDRRLLLMTSPFDRVSGGLCDAVLGSEGSGVALRRLSRSGVPLEPLDTRDDEFRLHPLVAEALRAELRREAPRLEPELQARASAWLEREGQAERAVEAAIAAGDAESAARLVSAFAEELVSGGRGPELGRRLERLGRLELADRPALAIGLALTRLGSGARDDAERWVAVAERALARDDVPADPALRAAAAGLRAAIARDGLHRMGADAARCRALAPEDGAWRAVADLLQGVALQLGGRPGEARDRLELAARLARGRLPLVRALALAQLALLALDDADGTEALALTGLVLASAPGDRPAHDEAYALVHAVAADALAQAGDVEAARARARHAQRLAAGLADPPPWYEVELRICLARAELRLSRASAARESLSKASRIARRLPEREVVQGWIDDAWRHADTFAAAAAAPEILTIAELRVLRFLPSHLSFREIAARLGVSPNTVKTQAHAVYRKLDASSRSEAVTRAGEIGLVDT